MEAAEGIPVIQKEEKRPRALPLRLWQKRLLRIFCGLLALWCCLQLWMITAEKELRWYPAYQKQDLIAILQKDKLDKGDYRTLYLQTGLGAQAVNTLKREGRAENFKTMQAFFFARPRVLCDKNTPVSAEEYVADEAGRKIPGTKLVGLEAGDILVTPSCHTFGWRNGHAALVVDAETGVALESVVLGQDSCLQPITKWESYPSFLVLRLKGAPREERAQVAAAAVKSMNGVPYGLTVGLLSEKYQEGTMTGTHCAHLVWSAFSRFGYDLDSTGGAIVTPKDLANSSLLEVVQVYGLDPDRLWD